MKKAHSLTPESLRQFLTATYSQFEAWDRYRLGDDILRAAFSRRDNREITLVYEKVALLDRLYGTNVFDAFKMAQHIVQCTIDEDIHDGNVLVIDSLRQGHGIKPKNGGKEKDLYSFATKYASWHRPDAFPMYDRLIGRIIPRLNRRLTFDISKPSQAALREYSRLTTALNSLRDLVGGWFDYKRLDKALWLWAKYEFKRDEIRKDIKAAIQRDKDRFRIYL